MTNDAKSKKKEVTILKEENMNQQRCFCHSISLRMDGKIKRYAAQRTCNDEKLLYFCCIKACQVTRKMHIKIAYGNTD